MNMTIVGQIQDEKKKIVAAYMDKAKMTTVEAGAAATGYLDAADDVMEGVYYGLRTFGPIDITIWTTKKGHQVCDKLYAGN